MLELINPRSISFVFRQFLFAACVFGSLAHAAAIDLNNKDFGINYFAVLGMEVNLHDVMSGQFAQPNIQQVQSAYRSKLAQLQSQNQTVDMESMRVLSRAKNILSDRATTEAYLTGVVSTLQAGLKFSPVGNHSLPPGVDPKSLVGIIEIDGQVVGGIQAAFNSAHKEESVALLRSQPEKNDAIKYMAMDVDAPAPPSLLEGVDFTKLDPKWRRWSSSVAGIRMVQEEFDRIANTARDINYFNFEEFAKTEAFLYWWFQQPESLKQKKMALKLMDRLDASGADGRINASLVMQASVHSPMGRTKTWINELLPRPKSLFALGPITGTDEVITKMDLIESILKLPDIKNYGHLVYEYLLRRPESVKHPEWALHFLNSETGFDKSFLNLFLKVLVHQPHWRQQHPDIITEALKRISEIKSGSRENYVFELLTKPEALRHPEWLEILIKTDVADFLTLKLNHLLATDAWYNNPYLRKILRGEAPTVEGLRQARWLRVVDVPNLVTTRSKSKASLRVVRTCESLFSE